MVDRIRYPTVSYLPFYYIFFEIDFQFLFLTIFNLQAKILAIKDILSNLALGKQFPQNKRTGAARGIRTYASMICSAREMCYVVLLK